MDIFQNPQYNSNMLQEKIIKTDEVLSLLRSKKKEVNKADKKYDKLLKKFFEKCGEIDLLNTSWEQKIKEVENEKELLIKTHNDFINESENRYQSACREVEDLMKIIDKQEQKEGKKLGKKSQENLTEVKHQLTKSNQTIADLREECKNLQQQKNDSLKQSAKLRLDYDELKKSFETNNSSNLELHEEIKRLVTKLETSEKKLNVSKLAQEFDSTELKNHYEKQIKLLSNQLEKIKTQKNGENSLIERDLIKQLETEKIIVEERHIKEIDSLKEQIKNCEERNKQKDEFCREIEKLLELSKQENQLLEEKFATSRNGNQTEDGHKLEKMLKEEIDKLRKVIDENVESHNREKLVLEQQIKEFSAKISEIKTKSVETQTNCVDFYNLKDIFDEMNNMPSLLSPFSPSSSETSDTKPEVMSILLTCSVAIGDDNILPSFTDSSTQTHSVSTDVNDLINPEINPNQNKIRVKTFSKNVETQTGEFATYDFKNYKKFGDFNSIVKIPENNVFERIPKNIKLKSRVTKKYKNNGNRLLNALKNSRLNLKYLVETYIDTSSKFVIVSPSILKSDKNCNPIFAPENCISCACQSNMFCNKFRHIPFYQISCNCNFSCNNNTNNCQRTRKSKSRSRRVEIDSDSDLDENYTELKDILKKYKNSIINKYITDKYLAKMIKNDSKDAPSSNINEKNSPDDQQNLIKLNNHESNFDKQNRPFKNVNNTKNSNNDAFQQEKNGGIQQQLDYSILEQFEKIIHDNTNLEVNEDNSVNFSEVTNESSDSCINPGLNKENVRKSEKNTKRKIEEIVNQDSDFIKLGVDSKMSTFSNKLGANLKTGQTVKNFLGFEQKTKKKFNITNKESGNFSEDGCTKIIEKRNQINGFKKPKIFENPNKINLQSGDNKKSGEITDQNVTNSEKNAGSEFKIANKKFENSEEIGPQKLTKISNQTVTINEQLEEIEEPEEIINQSAIHLKKNSGSKLKISNQKFENLEENGLQKLTKKFNKPVAINKKLEKMEGAEEIINQSAIHLKKNSGSEFKIANKKFENFEESGLQKLTKKINKSVTNHRKLEENEESREIMNQNKTERLQNFQNKILEETEDNSFKRTVNLPTFSKKQQLMWRKMSAHNRKTISATKKPSVLSKKPKTTSKRKSETNTATDYKKQKLDLFGQDSESENSDNSGNYSDSSDENGNISDFDHSPANRMTIGNNGDLINTKNDVENVCPEILSDVNKQLGVSKPENIAPSTSKVFKRPVRNQFNSKSSLNKIPSESFEELNSPDSRPIDNDVQKIDFGIAKKMINDVATLDWDRDLIMTVTAYLANKDTATVARLIVQQAATDFSQEFDKSFTPPAPLLTKCQQKLLVLLDQLEKSNLNNIYSEFVQTLEKRLLSENRVEVVHPLTRLFVTSCKLKYHIERVRTFCCNAAYYMGDLLLPVMFIVLTVWGDILPLAANSEDVPLAVALVQVIRLKNCKKPGYNFSNLNRLISDYYGYTQDTQQDEIIKKLVEIYSSSYSKTAFTAILILCKNLPNKWTYTQIKKYLLSLLDSNVNNENKSMTVSLIQRLVNTFNPNVDITYIIEIKNCLSKYVMETPSGAVSPSDS